MGFEQLKELIALLQDAPGVTEINITDDDCAQILVKRAASAAPAAAPETGLVLAESSEPAEIPESAVSGELETQNIPADRVGLFRNAKPQLRVGDTLHVGQIIGYIESIKLMNEIRSDTAGEVVDILADEGTPVEYGQPLLSIAPAS